MREQTKLIRRIKQRALILVVTALSTSFPVAAQKGNITLPVSKLKASDVFENIQKQTSYHVAANNRQTDHLSVNITQTSTPVKTVLDRLLAGSGLTYRVDGTFIIISAAPVEEAVLVKVDIPQTVSGTKTNGREPLAGGKLMETTDMEKTATAENAPSAPKATAYFIPKDHTIKALADEAKSDYSFVPSAHLNKPLYRPKIGIKTNLLYLATTSPNIAVEFALGKKWTLDIVAGVNTWDLNDRKGGIRHGLVQPEVRYWFCQRFEKHFIGLHGLYGQYEIADIDLHPIGNDLTGKRYYGWGAGAGVSYGYHLPMSKRWAWEFTVGAGYIYLDYDKYNCGACDNLVGKRTKNYFGPTKAGVSLIFMIK